MDVVHGYETIFPIPLGLSCSWNLAAKQLFDNKILGR
jgi:beta-glucosidase